MTEIRDTRLRELHDKAEAAQGTFATEQAKLYRSDGAQLYADTVHSERLSSLRSERNRTLKAIETEAFGIVEASIAEIEHAKNSDPMDLLNSEELVAANSRRGFASDAVRSLSEEDLRDRLASVLAGGDKSTIFAYWFAGRSRQKQILEERTASSDDVRNSSPTTNTTELDRVLEEMSALLGAGRSDEIEAANTRREEAIEVHMLAGSLQQDVRNAGQAYFQNAYAGTMDRIQRSQSLAG